MFYILKYFAVSNSIKRIVGHVTKESSPKSPATCTSTFDSLEGSDDEDNVENNAEINGSYLEADENAVSLVCVHFSLDFLLHIRFI